MFTLFGHPLSGNTHKVRLMLRAFDLAYREEVVDVVKGEQKQAAHLARNPRGQVPVLVDPDERTTIYDAQAILVYLARRFDRGGTWLGATPLSAAQVMQWLSFAANEIHNGPHLARLHYLLGVPMDIAAVQQAARASLALVEQQLARTPYLAGAELSVADLACYPCVALAPEGRVSLDGFPATRAWIDGLQAAAFHVAMPGLGAPSPL
ncbi:MAG: glutathione S-transferase family protein [Deltaproteobacteria bacterium]|nr:glutathione S-transferase family protein [Deltaproteobacteria bacterium]